jgi:hypothetical protein
MNGIFLHYPPNIIKIVNFLKAANYGCLLILLNYSVEVNGAIFVGVETTLEMLGEKCT